MSGFYCGAKKPPKNKKVGNPAQCKYKHQIRLYGLKKSGLPWSAMRLKTSGTGKIYCGTKKLPAGRRHGSAEQCKSKRQLRKWGVFSIGRNSTKIRSSVLRKRSNAAKIIQKAQKEKVLAKKRSMAAKRIQFLARKKAKLRKKIAQEKSKRRSAATRIQKVARGKAVRKFEKQRKSIEKKIVSEEKKKSALIAKEKAMAANKIAAMQKMRVQRKAHQKLMKRVNAAQFRRNKELEKFINKQNQLTGPKLIVPAKMVNGTPKVISKAETGSGAVVFSVPLNWGVKKGKLNSVSGSAETGTTLAVKINFDNLFMAMHEKNIYNNIGNLVNSNVTPFVMKSVGKNLSRTFRQYHSNIRKEFKGLVRNTEDIPTIPFVTESAGSGHIMSLSDFMDKNLCPPEEVHAFLFQLYYTLECFNQVGIRHNDLHHSNILVVRRSGLPKNSYREFKFFDYTTDEERTVLVPVTKYEFRIFDFDRGQKAKMDDFGYFIDMAFGTKDTWKSSAITARRNRKLKSKFSFSIDDEKQFPGLWDDVGPQMSQKHNNAQYDCFKVTMCFSTWYQKKNHVKDYLRTINDRNGNSIMYSMKKLNDITKKIPLDNRLFTMYNFPILEKPVKSTRHGVLRYDFYLPKFPCAMEMLSTISNELISKRKFLEENGTKLESYSIHNLYE